MLQAKLQSALKEQVQLVECVQQLESDKTSLEEHLNAVQEGLSQTVHFRFCETFVLECQFVLYDGRLLDMLK